MVVTQDTTQDTTQSKSVENKPNQEVQKQEARLAAKIEDGSVDDLISTCKIWSVDVSTPCSLCSFERDVNAVLNPCGHTALCMECAQKLKKCPLCRGSIIGVIHMYRA